MPRKPVRGPRPVPRYASATVFALLVLATVATFAWSQQRKREPLVLDRIVVGVDRTNAFTPNGDCRRDAIRIEFRTTISDRGTVQVIKPGGRTVITLDRDVFLKRYTIHAYHWDGRQRGGGIAPPGRYKLRVRLSGEDRLLVLPDAIRLHRAASANGTTCEPSAPERAP
jgi:hypothetical protein